MTKIYLIRHGQSEWNKETRIQGQKNTKLTDYGKEQAIKLGKRLINENIHIIYSSDLERAYNTGKLISNSIHKQLIPSKSLREMNFGLWEGLTINEIKDSFDEDYTKWRKDPHTLRINGAESLFELKERSMGFVNQIINMNQGKNIAIVSHSATLKTIILGLLGLDLSYYKNFTLSNVSLSIIECRDYNNVLTLLNDTSHLKELK